MKFLLFYVILLLIIFPLFAGIPEGYYEGTEGLSGDQLKAVLHEIIDDHIQFPYTSENTDVWDILKVTDADPNAPDSVILIYTGWRMNGEEEFNGGNGWNREHIWARSHGDFSTGSTPGTDVHHLRPSDITVNGARGNKDFADGGNEYIDPDGPTGCYMTNLTWEPRNEVKGDVARMIFYMAVRYEGEGSEPDLEIVDYVPSSPDSEPYHGKLSDLLEWHDLDPVDAWEENRNDIIYNDFQNNRNPFIDHPEFVDLIWDETSFNENILLSVLDFKVYPNPLNLSSDRSNTIISYFLPASSWVKIKMFNIRGELILYLIEEKQSAGYHTFTLARDYFLRSGISTGVYLFMIDTDNLITWQKTIILK